MLLLAVFPSIHDDVITTFYGIWDLFRDGGTFRFVDDEGSTCPIPCGSHRQCQSTDLLIERTNMEDRNDWLSSHTTLPQSTPVVSPQVPALPGGALNSHLHHTSPVRLITASIHLHTNWRLSFYYTHFCRIAKGILFIAAPELENR